MEHQIIAKFSDHHAVEVCVQELIEKGVSKDAISLITRSGQSQEIDPQSLGMLINNGEPSGEAAAVLVGGVLGTLIGSLVGLAAFAVPGGGIVLGAGPLVTALFGGTAGGVMGDEIGKNLDDAPGSDALHPYITTLNDDEVLCGVEVEEDMRQEVNEVISRYASALVQ